VANTAEQQRITDLLDSIETKLDALIASYTQPDIHTELRARRTLLQGCLDALRGGRRR
jgi:hypothetical protein